MCKQALFIGKLKREDVTNIIKLSGIQKYQLNKLFSVLKWKMLKKPYFTRIFRIIIHHFSIIFDRKTYTITYNKQTFKY